MKQNESIILIGDIHGCYLTLRALIDKLPKDKDGYLIHQLVFLGDLVDRGPRSNQVIQYAIDNAVYCVKGNHEQMMLDGQTKDSDEELNWRVNGGERTVQSYEVPALRELEDGTVVPTTRFDKKTYDRHLNWLKDLPLYLEFPTLKNDRGQRLIAAHSQGIAKVYDWDKDKRLTHKKTFKDVIMWDRGQPDEIPGAFYVHGHTPKSEPAIKSFYANIDTGACYKDWPLGQMTALQFPEMIIYSQDNIDYEQESKEDIQKTPIDAG